MLNTYKKIFLMYNVYKKTRHYNIYWKKMLIMYLKNVKCVYRKCS